MKLIKDWKLSARSAVGRTLSLLIVGWVATAAVAETAPGVGGAPTDIVFYVGNANSVKLTSVFQLSDGTLLIGGSSTAVDWLPASTHRTELAGTTGTAGPTARIPLILHASADLKTVIDVLTLPAGSAEEVSFIKSTSIPGQKTGNLYISGKYLPDKAEGNKGGFFVARLDHNFVDGAAPSKLIWRHDIFADDTLVKFQPWDVGADGKVVYATGSPHSYDWMAVERINADGQPDVVPNWRTHWYHDGAAENEFAGAPASAAPGPVFKSSIVLKTRGRGDFRSWTKEDFLAKSSDGNGGQKQGRWPLDAMFDGYYDPATKKTVPITGTKKGYYGYRFASTPCCGVGAIVIDRRNNAMFIGGNNKSVLPDGQPDFEPWVVAMGADGTLLWWQRLYSEEKGVSTPDQFVDALTIDYHTGTAGQLIVVARSHGNNVNNYWSGNAVKYKGNPGYAFQNGFTGTSGNMHFSWIGRLIPTDGTLTHCTYVAEYTEGTKYGDKPFSEPLLSKWPRFDSGWPNLNTTRISPNNVVVDAVGNIYVTAVGRRVVTTSNAYQQVPSPLADKGAVADWAHFVRVYRPDLTGIYYSSILSGPWDWKTGKGASDVNLQSVTPVPGGVVAVGTAAVDEKTGKPEGNEMPTRNVPAWGKSSRGGESGVIALFHFAQ